MQSTGKRFGTIAAPFFLAMICYANAGQPQGFTEPFHDLEIAATGEPGLITKINVAEGDKVSKGDVLAVIDTRVLEKSLAIAKRRVTVGGRFAAMKAEQKLRGDRLQKMEAMFQRQHVSHVEVERARADFAIAEANVRTAEEDRELAVLEVERIETQIERQKVRCPLDGVVVTLHREAGESIVVTDTKLLRLVSLDMLRVKFPVSVAQSLELEDGGYVEVTLPEIKERITAMVENISPVLDAKSGTVEVKCLIDNSEGKYRSGMLSQLQVTSDEPKELKDEEPVEFDYPSVSIDR